MHVYPVETIYGEKCESCEIYKDSFQCFSSHSLSPLFNVNSERNSKFVLFVFLLSSLTKIVYVFFSFFLSFAVAADDGVQIMR